MSDTGYQPPKKWTWDRENGGKWASVNQPVSGARQDKELPVGKHPFQLYSLATPNGQKATIMFEELLEAGETGAEYDAWLINIGEGDQFGSGFVDINPNSKIPALMDRSDAQPIRIFESGNILLYLAEKFDRFLPKRHAERTEALNWLFWLQGAAPYLGGGFGHFYAYAPYPMEYPIDRFTMEIKRQMHLLDSTLADRKFIGGDEYSIADIAIWPWYGNLVFGKQYSAGEFLNVQEYKNLRRWADEIAARPAVERGRKVNKATGEEWEQLHERHSAADFDKLPPKP